VPCGAAVPCPVFGWHLLLTMPHMFRSAVTATRWRSKDVHGNLSTGEGTAESLRVQVVRHGAAWYTLDADFLLRHLGKIIGHLQPQPRFRGGTKRLG
jgi:hypothetical protein